MKTTRFITLCMAMIIAIAQTYAQDKSASMVSQQMEGKYYTAVIVDTDFETTIENVKIRFKRSGIWHCIGN